LCEGDVVGLDVGATLGSWVGDTCYTYPLGAVSSRVGKLLEVARECPEAGVAEVGPGKHFGDVGAAIQELAEYHGYGLVRELGGHGVGHEPHEEPHISPSGAGVVACASARA
jgi:methionyl aminopeptidase